MGANWTGLIIENPMLVIDASVAVKFVTKEPGRDEALSILGGADEIVAPDWILMEVGHAMRRKVSENLLDADSAHNNLSQLPTFFDRILPSSEFLQPALRLAFAIDHALYDCLYLALALSEGGVLLTADRKFWNAAKRGKLDATVRLLTWAEQPA
jgi:predicted nucleic acid-binding protein